MDRCLSTAQQQPSASLPLWHCHQNGVCSLCAGSYQTFAHLSHSLQVRVGLSLQTEVRVSSTYSHWSDSRPLPFYYFSLKEVYRSSIQVITLIPSACNHRFVPCPLHPHGYWNILPPCSYSHRSGPRLPWDGYIPFLGRSTSHVDGHETPLLWIILMFHGSASS